MGVGEINHLAEKREDKRPQGREECQLLWEENKELLEREKEKTGKCSRGIGRRSFQGGEVISRARCYRGPAG